MGHSQSELIRRWRVLRWYPCLLTAPADCGSDVLASFNVVGFGIILIILFKLKQARHLT